MGVIRRAELDMIGFDVGSDPKMQGQISLRWRKMVYVDDELVATDYHRTVIDVDTDLDATLEAVAQHLERIGFNRPPESDRGYIDDACARAWTPEVREAVAVDRIENAQREALREEITKKAREDREAREAEHLKESLRQLGVIT